MAAPLSISRLSREDFNDAPGWFDRLLQWLNRLLEQLSFAIAGNLTFAQNIQSQEKNFTVTAGAAAINNTLSFICTMKTPPTRLFLGKVTLQAGNYTPIGAAVFVEWRYDSGTVFITSIAGLSAGSIYDFVVLLT